MKKSKFVGFILLVCCALALADETDTSSMTYQNCVDSWTIGLGKDYPDLAKIDASYIAAYYCNCGGELAEKIASLSKEEKAKQTFLTCMPYAVLRNTLHYDLENDQGDKIPASADVLNKACINGYPHAAADQDAVRKITAFCGCAASTLAEIQSKKKTLSESDIQDQVASLSENCANQ